MKKGQSVILLTFKESGETFVFGSLAAVYAMYTDGQLGIKYTSLRNAVSLYIREHEVSAEANVAQVIYDANKSLFFLRRAPLLLADKADLKK